MASKSHRSRTRIRNLAAVQSCRLYQLGACLLLTVQLHCRSHRFHKGLDSPESGRSVLFAALQHDSFADVAWTGFRFSNFYPAPAAVSPSRLLSLYFPYRAAQWNILGALYRLERLPRVRGLMSTFELLLLSMSSSLHHH